LGTFDVGSDTQQSNFVEALARYRAAKAAEDHFDATVYWPASEACERAEAAFEAAYQHRDFMLAFGSARTSDYRAAAMVPRSRRGRAARCAGRRVVRLAAISQ